MLKTFRQIAAVGIVTEPPPRPDQALRLREALQARILVVLGRALCIQPPEPALDGRDPALPVGRHYHVPHQAGGRADVPGGDGILQRFLG